uniref:FGGY_C domain-containing protein n=1 Tax=Anisakis simplex TaxID=6269 RepID=A0A0M3JHK2_ANISI
LSSSDTTLVLPGSASTLLTMIESPLLNGVSGKYFDSRGRQIRSGSEATDERLQQKLWKYSEQLCAEFLKYDDNLNYDRSFE